MTWIKICGTTNLEDAMLAIDAGADALGFVFYEKSPRYIIPKAAGKIIAELPRKVEKVGVFVNQFEDAVCRVADEAGLTMIQMHGDNEDPHVADLILECREDLKILASISMQQPKPERSAMMWGPDVISAFLLDSGNASKYGGTGKSFDWQTTLPSVEVISRLGKIIVAGGLTPTNVTEAIRILKPWGVDVVSGVEASPGKKDPEKVRAFIEAVRKSEKIS
jgi:phosphoribosylanthranilate isomerase